MVGLLHNLNVHMKKIAWGTVICVGLVSAVFSCFLLSPQISAPVNASSNISRQIMFDNNGFSALRTNGIFIIRDDAMASTVSDFATYSGRIEVGTEIVNDGFQVFDFQPVKDVGGQWFTSREYAISQGRTPQAAAGMADWFYIHNIRYDCNWELPINTPAGKYGVRARAGKMQYDSLTHTDQFVPVDKNGNVTTANFVDFYFTILYGDDFEYIRVFDSRNDTVHSVNRHGSIVRINVLANSGAMRHDVGYRALTSLSIEGYIAGIIEAPIDISWSSGTDVSVSITRNSRAVTNIQPVWRNSGLDIVLPRNLQKGQYLVTISHAYKPNDIAIIGTYVIDNGDVLASNTTKNVGIVILVIGLVGFAIGFILVTGPQLSFFINKQRIKSIDDKIYGRDGKSIRLAEKAAKEKQKLIASGELKKERDESRSFSAQMEKFQFRRAEARRLGLTMEEYTEIERRQGAKATIEKFGIADARRVIGGNTISMTEDLGGKRTTKFVKDGVEFELLDSAKMDKLTSVDQFAGVSQDVIKEAIKPLEADQIGLLGRIKNFLESN